MCQLLISKQRILHHKHRHTCRQALHGVRHHNTCSAQLYSLGAIIMAVKIASL